MCWNSPNLCSICTRSLSNLASFFFLSSLLCYLYSFLNFWSLNISKRWAWLPYEGIPCSFSSSLDYSLRSLFSTGWSIEWSNWLILPVFSSPLCYCRGVMFSFKFRLCVSTGMRLAFEPLLWDPVLKSTPVRFLVCDTLVVMPKVPYDLLNDYFCTAWVERVTILFPDDCDRWFLFFLGAPKVVTGRLMFDFKFPTGCAVELFIAWYSSPMFVVVASYVLFFSKDWVPAVVCRLFFRDLDGMGVLLVVLWVWLRWLGAFSLPSPPAA